MAQPQLQLDSVTGDLDFSPNGLRSEENIAQTVQIRLRFFLGEHFLDTSVGTPYFERIFGKQTNLGHITSIFRQRILGSDGVQAITSLSVELDAGLRKLSVEWEAESETGTTSDLTEIQV